MTPSESRKYFELSIRSSYNANYSYFIKILFLTRLPGLKKNKWLIGEVQASMLRHLEAFQEALKRLNEEKKLAPDNSGLETRILIEKNWIRILQTIADGIAWRSFRYNRPILRLLADNKSIGSLKQQDYDYVEVLRGYLKAAKHFVIANDLTRFLRVGDLTMFYPDGRVYIHELKKKGRKVYDAKKILEDLKITKTIPRPQRMRHLISQRAIATSRIDIPIIKEGSVIDQRSIEIIDLDFRIGTHFKKLGRLIRKADKKCFAVEEVEPGYYIEVVALDKYKNANSTASESVLYDLAPEWVKKKNDDVIMISNYDSFIDVGKDFPRNFVPYSVFPYSNTTCVRLMMGRLFVRTYIDTQRVRERLVSEGWEVEDTDIWNNLSKADDANESKQLFYSKLDETLFKIKKMQGTAQYIGSVLLTDILIMATSFYSINFITRSAEAVWRKGMIEKRTRIIARNWLGERKLLK